MADNTRGGSQDSGDPLIASDEVTYSGDTADVQLVRIVDVTGSEGSKTVNSITSSTGVTTGGNVAHDAVDSGNPNKIGGKAKAAAPTDVSADGDRVDAWFLRNGALATTVTAAGALVGGDATNGLDVDVTRLPAGSIAAATSLPAGTNNIGDVDVLTIPAPLSTTGGGTEATAHRVTIANDSTGVLSVDDNGATLSVDDGGGSLTVDGTIAVSSVIPGTGATNQGKAIDSVAGATDTGIAALAIRDDALSTLTPADGDYAPLRVNSNGALWVAGTASTEYSEGDIDASITGVAMMWEDASDTMRSVSAAKPLPVSGTISTVTTLTGTTTLTPGSGATNLGKAVDSVVGANDVGVAALVKRKDTLATLTPADGDYVTLQTDSQGALWVNPGNGPSQYTEDSAHVSGDSGDLILSVRRDTMAASAADGDYSTVNTDALGRLYTNPGPGPGQFVSKAFNATTTQTGTDVWSPASGKKIAVTSVVIGTYGTTAARVILWFGDNADTTFTAGTDQQLLAASFAPSSTVKPGMVFTPSSPVYCNTADRELHITTDAAISIDVTVHGFEF